MPSGRERTAREGTAQEPGPRRSERALAVVMMATRAMQWAMLTIGLFGTALTANQLPPPWAALLPPLCALGGIAAGLTALHRFFLASLATLNLIRSTLRPQEPSGSGKQSNTPEQVA